MEPGISRCRWKISYKNRVLLFVAKSHDYLHFEEKDCVLCAMVIPYISHRMWHHKCLLHKFLLMENVRAPCKTKVGHMAHSLLIPFLFFSLSLTPALILTLFLSFLVICCRYFQVLYALRDVSLTQDMRYTFLVLSGWHLALLFFPCFIIWLLPVSSCPYMPSIFTHIHGPKMDTWSMKGWWNCVLEIIDVSLSMSVCILSLQLLNAKCAEVIKRLVFAM